MVSRMKIAAAALIGITLAASAFPIPVFFMMFGAMDSFATNGTEGEAPPSYHPADGNEDWYLSMSEAIAYLAGWQQGANPMTYAIRAAYVWRKGESYSYNPEETPPLCWAFPTVAEGEGEALAADLVVFGQRLFLDANANGVFDLESDTQTEGLAFDPGTLVFNVFEIVNLGESAAPSFLATWQINDVVSHEEAVDTLAPGAKATLSLARLVEEGRNAIGVEVSSEADPHTENNAGLHSYLGISEKAVLNPGALIAGVDKGGIVVLEDDGETILLQSAMAPAPGRVVLNAALGGRLVRLTSVLPEGGYYRCATEPVGLAQLLDEGSMVFSVEIPAEHFQGLGRVNYEKGSVGISLGGISLSAAGGDPGCNLTLTEGSIVFTPTYDFALNFNLLQGLTYARIAARGALDLNYEWEAEATVAGSYSLSVDLSEIYPELHIPSYPFYFVLPLPPPLPPLPVHGEVKFRLKAGYERNFSRPMTLQTGFDYHPSVRIGAEFDDGRWTNLSSIDLIDFNPHLPVASHEGAAALELFIKPEVFIELYTVGGPVFGLVPYGEVGYVAPPPPGECPFYMALGLDAEFGVAMNILDMEQLSCFYNLPRYPMWRREWPLGCGTPMLTVEPLAPAAGPEGGSAQLAVSNSGSGYLHWNAEVTSGGGWLQITAGNSGINAGTISYSVAPNTTSSQRTGIIQVAAQGACDGSPRYVTVTQSAQSQPETETILLPGDVPLEMVWIPGGAFLMGRYPGEEQSDGREDPQHPVTVPGFWMGKYEVTKGQWTAVMGTTPWSGRSEWIDDPDSPAVFVSWNDVKSFITVLNAHTEKSFRLPTEAEWEYACRARTTTRFYWGDDRSYGWGNDYCWRHSNTVSVGEEYAHVVGLKLPNGFGLFDMSGNVEEMCEDDWHYQYIGAPSDGSAWVCTPRDEFFVRRGGAWKWFHPKYLRSAFRDYDTQHSVGSSTGFRVARTN